MWTCSGDAIIASGTHVALWKRQNDCWEITWTSKAEAPQCLVSATWNAEGPVTTAAGNLSDPSLSREDSTRVSVYQSDGRSGVLTTRLRHPQPVTMVRWRPSRQMSEDVLCSWRVVLLTCCLDGTVRLWSEVDNSRVKKSGKDVKSLSFHVVAAIEINQPMKGTLGVDVFIEWAIELGAVISKTSGEGYRLFSPCLEHDQIGKCEWLVGVGPSRSITFWAIHCLDDMNPLRFPRVTLWVKRDFDSKLHSLCNSDSKKFEGDPVLVKVICTRRQPHGPPDTCSLLQLLSDNSVSWLQVYNPTHDDSENNVSSQTSKEKSLSCCAGGVLDRDGHTGTILQLAVHPNCEVELACSLDSNGLLLFWSIPTISNCTLGVQMLSHSVWELLDKISSQHLSTGAQYSSLRWAPSVLDENLFLLLGHASGIDCFLIKVLGNRKGISCHKILAVPFPEHIHVEGPPDQISAIPFASTSGPSFFSNSFLLFGIWATKKFQAISWKVILHSSDPSGNSYGCNSDSLPGKTFYATIDLGSSNFPDLYSLDYVVSVSVVSPDNSVLSSQQCKASYNITSIGYHIATGCSDGSLKLWKMSHVESVNSECEFVPWELVGMFTAHCGPVSAVSLSSCGNKIATVSRNDRNNTTSVHIWEPISLINGGSFLLEDAITFDGHVVTLNWLSIGNGRLLLAVCMPDELRIYSEKRYDLFLMKPEDLKEMHIWCCIALSHTHPISHGFVWGPKMTPVLVHKKHFSVLSQWLAIAEHGIVQVSATYADKTCVPCPIFVGGDTSSMRESSNNENKEIGPTVCTFCSKSFQEYYDSDTAHRVHNLAVVADRLSGTLAAYHPMALIHHLYSGNWKRAHAVLKHLVGAIKSSEASTNSKYGKLCSYIPEMHLSGYFEENPSKELNNKGFQWGQDIAPGTSDLLLQSNTFHFADSVSKASAPNDILSPTSQKSDITGFIDTLESSYVINAFTNVEKTQIHAMVDLLVEVSESGYSSAYGNLDKPGRRFWVAVRFQRLYSIRKFGPLATEEFIVNSRLFAWAFQSDCQDSLLNSLLSAEPSWLEMRNLGVGFWFTGASQLRTRMEKLARSQYLKKKDPKDCALLYLALNRLQVLTGLFKISKDEKDKPLVGFLSRNFQDEKNKAAALKNAYVLMGRHQLELAIAFFLLGGDSSSAVTVCAKNLGDEQLALVICRLIEGHGGPLERHLISNIMLPNAIEKEDYWLASILEWSLGNYTSSIRKLLDSQMGSVVDTPAMCNLAAFADPDIGQYCVTLAAKTNMKNSIGDYPAMVLCKLATFMAVSAFSRCGFPLEALVYFSSSFSIEVNNLGNLLDIGNHEIFCRLLNPFCSNVHNWLLADLSSHLDLNAKLSLAMKCVSRFLADHPSWFLSDLSSSEKSIIHEYDSRQGEPEIAECKQNLDMLISMFEKKYLLQSGDLTHMILIFAYNKGLFFHSLRLLLYNSSQEHETDYHSVGTYMLSPHLPRLLLKAIEEINYVFCQHVVCFSLTDSTLRLLPGRSFITAKDRLEQFHHREFCLRSVMYALRTIRQLLKLSSFNVGSYTLRILSVLDLLEYCGQFASTWFSRNVNRLILLIQTIHIAHADDLSSLDVVIGKLMKNLYQTSDQMVYAASGNGMGAILGVNNEQKQLKQSEGSTLLVPEDEMWQLIGASLWIDLSGFAKHQLSKFVVTNEVEHESAASPTIEFPVLVARLFMSSMAYISSSITRQLASFLRYKASKGLPVTSFAWLDESSQHHSRFLHSHLNQGIAASQQINDEEKLPLLQKLWEISVNLEKLSDSFVTERIICFPYNTQKVSGSWKDIMKDNLAEYENGASPKDKSESSNGCKASMDEVRSSNRVIVTDGLLETKWKGSSLQSDLTSFNNPREVLKRKGELLEALCFNSVDEQQVAVASNKKGLLFFNWTAEHHFKKEPDYMWSESDWPQDGWAGCESTPVPTYVSQGIGLGSKRGAHLGLGGATVGLGSLARPGRDMTGGGAFGIPGYAGIGASSLGWGEQEDFEEFVDPPATVANISSRTLSRHPSRPLFLAGSSNTHIYLWEFGKDRATATYGVLPAANVPPPYALASISSLEFDHCGQRFATAALDGTVCTWQLEVGGRSNVHPTDSSFCFNNHASVVAYVAASGSILAAAGCSSNGVNVVVWDTLAPPVTSQASLVCHEGGARSLSVFDNDIGTGSISPLIVTGGEGGDVALHDFRFIATGKTKRHRNSSQQDLKSSAMHDKGMLWYIPKAHLGSVTKISTIPNTSLFLTGSKDGDVKLWDAKRSLLMFHWQKMHDRHTFLQPNSRSIGGVVRAAVTDIQVLSHGFLTCGGDGSVKLVELKK